MPWMSRGYLASLLFSALLLYFVALHAAGQAYRLPEVNVTKPSEPPTAAEIFLHNLSVSWYLLVPAVGLFPFLWVWYATGLSIGAAAKALGVPPLYAIFTTTTVVFPEFLAYTVMTAENIYSSVKLLTGDRSRFGRPYLTSFLLYLILLFIGALWEASLI